MTNFSKSFEKVQYDLRPAKQTERRMIIDGLQLLAMEGFPIRDYHYSGMGSIFFWDFILFHKLLGIEHMTSVEGVIEIQKRVTFNRPFKKVSLEMGSIGSHIQSLSQDQNHILWLDYDEVLKNEHLNDITQAVTRLSRGSILLITVDAEPPGPPGGKAKDWCEHFKTEAEIYLPTSVDPKDFSLSKLPKRNVEIISKAIFSGLQGRSDVEFFPLFNFEYKDTHRMITLGGMIGTKGDKRKVKSSRTVETNYYRDSFDKPSFKINIPSLTRKERLLLDAMMPCEDTWKPGDFEISEKDIHSYREIYRFLPAYAELLV